jgi:hypothetical protein
VVLITPVYLAASNDRITFEKQVVKYMAVCGPVAVCSRWLRKTKNKCSQDVYTHI